jgi:hypothetical protein
MAGITELLSLFAIALVIFLIILLIIRASSKSRNLDNVYKFDKTHAEQAAQTIAFKPEHNPKSPEAIDENKKRQKKFQQDAEKAAKHHKQMMENHLRQMEQQQRQRQSQDHLKRQRDNMDRINKMNQDALKRMRKF